MPAQGLRAGAPVDIGRLVHLPALQQLRLRRGRARVSAGLRPRAGAAHRRQLFYSAKAGQERTACTLAGSVPAQTAAAHHRGGARVARDAQLSCTRQQKHALQPCSGDRHGACGCLFGV
jgi:hypothetical protein